MLGVSTSAGKAARTWSESCSAADPQQDSLYRWESEWRSWNRAELTLTECRAAVDWACDQFGIEPPRIRTHKSKAFSWCHVGERVISFSLRGKNVATALHEASHLIVNDLFGSQSQDHGPTFLGVYLLLMEMAGVAPRAALHATARRHGLRWRRDVCKDL